MFRKIATFCNSFILCLNPLIHCKKDRIYYRVAIHACHPFRSAQSMAYLECHKKPLQCCMQMLCKY